MPIAGTEETVEATMGMTTDGSKVREETQPDVASRAVRNIMELICDARIADIELLSKAAGKGHVTILRFRTNLRLSGCCYSEAPLSTRSILMIGPLKRGSLVMESFRLSGCS